MKPKWKLSHLKKHPNRNHDSTLQQSLWGATGLLLTLVSPVSAESRLEKLPGSLLPLPLVNGPEVRRALLDLSRQVLPSSGWLEDAKGRALVGVTFVGKDGYFISKASEILHLSDCRLRPRPSEDTWAVREVHRDVKLDLVLGQALTPDNRPISVVPVTWAPSTSANLGIGWFPPH